MAASPGQSAEIRAQDVPGAAVGGDVSQQEREQLLEARRRHLSAVADIERRLGIKPRHVHCRECGSIVDTRARHTGRG